MSAKELDGGELLITEKRAIGFFHQIMLKWQLFELAVANDACM